ncbi:MAG: autotransporter outer membrane beta-barrel domain-containing protein [Afipia felis]|nr:autotransporter outer membrane beta-barrel domain-containing protein [Afipia felis]
MIAPPPAAKRTASASTLSRAAAIGAFTAATLPCAAYAQFAPPTPLYATSSAGAAQLDLGSNFLQRLGRAAATGYAARDNSAGGGASTDFAAPVYRSWFEGYGTSARTDVQPGFVGDKRSTAGGVAGIGMTVAPGFNLGIAVDQSHTNVDVPLALQSAKLDLTQLGVNGSYVSGPWTVAFAAVHGFASIDAKRATFSGPALSSYRGAIDGALGELSYYQALGQSRIVPKVAIEYVVARTNAFSETGGFEPVSVAESNAQRARFMLGAEAGHYWIVGSQIIDVSGYGKFVDNFSQSMPPYLVSLGANSILMQGVRESRYGADAGAGLSWSMNRTARLYANYDGKFRDGFHSHQGTVGLEFKW